jgi:TIR domain
VFLRGCGVPDTFITFARSLVKSAIDFYSCFISYSSKNHEFAERLYADLQNKGVRCWFAPEDIKIGDKFRQRIDESIRLHDKLLLILSGHSISSPWVEEEVESAFEREHKEKRLVLFPVRIDDAVMRSDQAWAASLRRMRHIGDFTDWKNHESYQKAFAR